VTYPPAYHPGPEMLAQLEFALKYDGVNLEVLAAIFLLHNDETFASQLTEFVRQDRLPLLSPQNPQQRRTLRASATAQDANRVGPPPQAHSGEEIVIAKGGQPYARTA
jgi:hypothetical protein